MPVPSHPLAGAAIDPAIARGIRQASAGTQVDFSYLVATARQESGLHTDAKAATGTATGLFQFTEGTWLDMVQRHGAKYGIGALAQQISSDGAARVADPNTRREILALRGDPRLSAAFAAEYTRENKTEVERALGRPAGHTDLYMAHFLGAGGATEFLKAVHDDAGTIGAELLPAAAAANPGVFYDKRTGLPRTVSEIYRGFAEKLNAAAPGLQDSPAVGVSAPSAPISARGIGFAALMSRVTASGTNLMSLPLSDMLDAFAVTALKLLRGNADAHRAAAPGAPVRRSDSTAV